jgi:hypothetical protein
LRVNIASFRSLELDELSGECASNSVDVARGLANEYVPNEGGVENENTTFAAIYNSLIKDQESTTTYTIVAKVGDYYYLTPGYRGALCAESTADQTKEGDAMNAIYVAVKAMVKE